MLLSLYAIILSLCWFPKLLLRGILIDILLQHSEYSKEVLFQELDGEAVLLDLNSEQYFGLDTLGTRIWQLIESKDNLAAIHQTLLAEYDVSSEQLRDDLIKFTQQLLEVGLITLHDNATPAA